MSDHELATKKVEPTKTKSQPSQEPLAPLPKPPAPRPDAGRRSDPEPSSSAADGDDRSPMATSMRQVEHSFHWYSDALRDRLDGLRSDLKKEDAPPWSERLLVAALEIALAAGAQASGLYLASQVVSSDVAREFVQNLFAGGVDAGIAAGRAVLGGSKHEMIDAFVASQKQGVWARQMRSQTEFIQHGRARIQTDEQMQQLEAACSLVNINAAAELQYDASRDAWVTLLAQAHLGTTIWNTTNMDSDGERDAENARRRKRHLPEGPDRGPSLGDSLLGHSPGVLQLAVDVPEIEKAMNYASSPPVPKYTMLGAPRVRLALLNGVNEELRKQYERMRLADLRIPFQVHVSAEGAPDFVLTFDERAQITKRPSSIRWLADRAVASQQSRHRFDDDDNSIHGVNLLLRELEIGTIDSSMSGA